MTRSESIKELAAALAKAQGAIKGALKDRTNPHFKSQYADLASVWEACRAQLTANGIAVIQGVECDGKTSVRVETTLAHASGEWVSSTLELPSAQASAQGMGSAITYARRYGLSAMVGIAPTDDDDGEAASRSTVPPPPVPAKPAPAPAAHDLPTAIKAMWSKAERTFGATARKEWDSATMKALGDPIPSKSWTLDQLKLVETELFRDDIQY
jgi:hypothetical protein